MTMTTTILDPHTKMPVVPDAEELFRQLEAKRRAHQLAVRRTREAEQKLVEQAAAVVPRRYALMPGRILVRVRPVEQAWDEAGDIAMTEDRQDLMRAHEPWGTILMVGASFYTDYGQRVNPDPEWRAGKQVLFNPAGATEVELEMPGSGEKLALSLIGFRSVVLVDRGYGVSEVGADMDTVEGAEV